MFVGIRKCLYLCGQISYGMTKLLRFLNYRKETWALWGVLTATLLVKSLIFHITCFENGFHDFFPLTASLCYAMAVAIPALISKHKWPLIVTIIIVDLWMISNVLYYRANELFITVDSVKMIGGLKEFGGSLTAYTVPLMWVNSLVGILAIVGICLMPKSVKRAPITAVAVIGFTYIVTVVPEGKTFYKYEYLPYSDAIKFYAEQDDYGTPYRQDHTCGKYGQLCFMPYNQTRIAAIKSLELTNDVVRINDILWYAGAIIVYDLAANSVDDSFVQPLDEKEWTSLLDVPAEDSLRGDLIIILVESLESWPLLQEQAVSEEIAPNLMNFIQQEGEHILYCTDVRSQVRHGVSGDGQMLVNTGMLPLRNGAACMLYADNKWPNIASHYEHSVVINPSKYAWNQVLMTPAYGYKNEITQEEIISDGQVFEQLIAVSDTIQSPFCVQVITMDTHTPFSEGRDRGLQLPDGMPQYMHDYIGCYNKVDECLGKWLNLVKDNEKLRNATIVITGDHSIFKEAYLRDFHKFAQSSGWNIPEKESACPLIIYSPDMKGRRIDTPLYQMDIYPTLREWLGIRSERWKGFGIDILQNQQRILDCQEASNLSERIIRTNGHLDR